VIPLTSRSVYLPIWWGLIPSSASDAGIAFKGSNARAETVAAWLDPKATAPQWLQTVLRPYPAEVMHAMPVSSWVNDALHEGSECIQPLA
jgi:putative SOS response-associated peptidase YedK